MKRDSSGNKGLRTLFFTLFLLIAGFIAVIRFSYRTPATGETLSLDYVYQLAGQGQIKEARLLDEVAFIEGKRCTVTLDVPQKCPRSKTKEFHSAYPQSDVATSQLIQTLTLQGAEVTVDKQTSTAVSRLLLTFVFPLAMLANLFGIIFTWKGGESSISDIVGFGTISRKKQREKQTGTGVTFANVAGAEEPVAEMREVIDYLKNPKKFEEFGASPPKGVLLFGPPGCGKTLMARATAGESKVPFFSVSGTEFVESLVGVGAARVRDIFRQVRQVAPAIMFIDEIDAVGRKRTGEGASGGEREQTLNQLLVELDGFDVTEGVVVMGATNRPDILDAALMRPGRFDRHVTLLPPDVTGRKEILELHAKGRPMANDVDLALLARRTPGFTGADLANVINEAALLAIREGSGIEKSPRIRGDHLTEAVQRVLHGPQRRGTIMNKEERRRIAYHEAGHAVVATSLSHHADVQRLSIVARGRGLGQAMVAEESDRVLLTIEEMQTKVAVAMAGTVAERLIFGSSSTTAEEDIETANGLAREMVGLYGMSPKVGPMHLLSRYEGYLENDAPTLSTMSPPTMTEFENEVKRLIQFAEKACVRALELNRAPLENLVSRLEQEETLEAESLDRLLAGVQKTTIGLKENKENGHPAFSPADAGNAAARKPGAETPKRT